MSQARSALPVQRARADVPASSIVRGVRVRSLQAVLEAADALDALQYGAPMYYLKASFPVSVKRDAWLEKTETLRERARKVIDFERGRAQTPLTDTVDALVRLGADGPRVPFTKRVLIDRDEYDRESSKLRPALFDVEFERLASITEEIELDRAPGLRALVNRVAREGRRFMIVHDGPRVAQLLEPPPDPPL